MQQVSRRSHAIEQLLSDADARTKTAQPDEARAHAAVETSSKLDAARIRIAELEHRTRVTDKQHGVAAEAAAATISQLVAERDRARKDTQRAEASLAKLQLEVEAQGASKQDAERKQLILYEQLTGARPR